MIPTAFPLARTARLAFCAAAIVVLYFALAPVSGREPLTGWDKANHVLAFATLAVLGLLGWASRERVVLTALLGYGLLIEVLQLATVDHHFDLHDIAADAVGLALGWCVLRAWRFTAARLR